MVNNTHELNTVKDLGIDLISILVRRHFNNVKDEKKLNREIGFSISKTVKHWGYKGILKNLLKLNNQDLNKVKKLIISYDNKSQEEINLTLSELLSQGSLEIAPVFGTTEGLSLIH